MKTLQETLADLDDHELYVLGYAILMGIRIDDNLPILQSMK